MEESTAVLQQEAFQQHLAWLPHCHFIKPAIYKQQGTTKALSGQDVQKPTHVTAGVTPLQLHPPWLVTNTLVPSHLAQCSLLQATLWGLTWIVLKSGARFMTFAPGEQDCQATAEERIISTWLVIYPHSSFMNEHTHIRMCLSRRINWIMGYLHTYGLDWNKQLLMLQIPFQTV